MFKKISIAIAWQFTGFVFVLFLINGILFLSADFGNARRDAQMRLERTANVIIDRLSSGVMNGPALAPNVRERVRVMDASGHTAYSGILFENIPFNPKPGLSEGIIDDDRYSMVTLPVTTNGVVSAYVQILEIQRLQITDLPIRASIYLLISALISLLTFVVGLFFARRSLQPAAETVKQLEQFTQDASHELKTPLAVLNSSLDLSLKTKKYREGILSAKEDVKEISTLVERLLELARLDSLSRQNETIDLSTLTAQIVERYALLATEKSITMESAIAPNISAKGDEALIRQILGNLLSNAIKFTPEKGTIRIRLNKDTLEIEDTGIGISPAELPHIFDRFYQADSSRTNEGFGLGLSIVKRIIDLHGWTIDVQSKENKGTCFTIGFSRKRQKSR